MQDSRGQTLIEVIVASGIIMSAVASSLTLMTAAIRANKTSESQITAGNLAREGIEVVRSIRDANWLAGSAFDAGLSSGTDYTGTPYFTPGSQTWTMNFAANTINDNTARTYRYALTETYAGLTVQAAAQPTNTVITPYRRLVTLDPLCDNGAGGYTIVTSGASCATTKIGMRVSVTVQWTLGGTNRTLTMEERLMDWR